MNERCHREVEGSANFVIGDVEIGSGHLSFPFAAAAAFMVAAAAPIPGERSGRLLLVARSTRHPVYFLAFSYALFIYLDDITRPGLEGAITQHRIVGVMLPKIQDHPDKFLRHCVRRAEIHELTDSANLKIIPTVAYRRHEGWRIPIPKLDYRLTESLAKVVGNRQARVGHGGFLPCQP
jgi:hypothetical protein